MTTVLIVLSSCVNIFQKNARRLMEAIAVGKHIYDICTYICMDG